MDVFQGEVESGRLYFGLFVDRFPDVADRKDQAFAPQLAGMEVSDEVVLRNLGALEGWILPRGSSLSLRLSAGGKARDLLQTEARLDVLKIMGLNEVPDYRQALVEGLRKKLKMIYVSYVERHRNNHQEIWIRDSVTHEILMLRQIVPTP